MNGVPPEQIRSKPDLRAWVRPRIAEMTPDQRSAGSRAIVRRLLERPEWQYSQAVAAYHPRADEPDVLPVFEAAWSAGKLLALPAFEAASGHYRMRRVAGFQDLVPGAFGVMEPAASCPGVAVEALDLALVPGICFSPEGGRIGRGRGFYDRLLASFHGVVCGVGFDCQVVPYAPMEPHDVPMQLILTPSSVRTVARG